MFSTPLQKCYSATLNECNFTQLMAKLTFIPKFKK